MAYLETDPADVRKTPLANGLPHADPCLPCLSSALAGFSSGEYHDMTGGNNAYYIHYVYTRRKEGYIPIPVYALSIIYRFLYIKNIIPIDNIKIACLHITVRILFKNPFSDEKNIIENKINENKTDKNKIENKTENKNKTK